MSPSCSDGYRLQINPHTVCVCIDSLPVDWLITRLKRKCQWIYHLKKAWRRAFSSVSLWKTGDDTCSYLLL